MTLLLSQSSKVVISDMGHCACVGVWSRMHTSYKDMEEELFLRIG